MMGFAEFIIGPAEGRTRWLYPFYGLKTAAAPAPLSGARETPRRRRTAARKRARAHNLDMAARGLNYPEAFLGNEALDFALD